MVPQTIRHQAHGRLSEELRCTPSGGSPKQTRAPNRPLWRSWETVIRPGRPDGTAHHRLLNTLELVPPAHQVAAGPIHVLDQSPGEPNTPAEKRHLTRAAVQLGQLVGVWRIASARRHQGEQLSIDAVYPECEEIAHHHLQVWP